MNSSLPELSGVAVLLPVVVPVPPAIGPKTKDIDLEKRRDVVNVYRFYILKRKKGR